MQKVREAGALPFLTDTTTLYSGTRHNAVDHINTAIRHGFAPGVVDAPVIIADGLFGQNDLPVEINCKHFKTVHIATEIVHTPAMVVLSHFKGHEAAGFGGAIKNLAMGCASQRGKEDQHGCHVNVNQEKCVGCGTCADICNSHIFVHDRAVDRVPQVRFPDECWHCDSCVIDCPKGAIALRIPLPCTLLHVNAATLHAKEHRQ